MNKKGQLAAAMNQLSAVAIGFFVFIIVVFATLKGAATIKSTVTQNSVSNNATYNNMTKLENSIGQFAEYGDLIVIIAILAVVIALVASAFVIGRR